MQRTRARLLKNPKFQFGGSQTDLSIEMQWDLHKEYLTNNSQEHVSEARWDLRNTKYLTTGPQGAREGSKIVTKTKG